MTKFCPWARWGRGVCRRVGSRSDLRDAADKYFLHHVDDLISDGVKSSVTGSRSIYKAVETRCGLRFIKTAIAHTTKYKCCVNIKNTTSYLQRPYNAGPISTTSGQELTSKYVGLTHDITVLFKQR